MTSTDRSARPSVVEPVWHAIPPELRDLPQWVMWTYEPKGNGWTKVPRNARGGPASSTDARTWSTFEQAHAAHRRGGFDGVGFVTARSDPYALGDLDKVIDLATGEVTGWARAILEAAEREGAYVEISPSGRGYHIIGRGPQGPGRKRHDAEFYSNGRFFTITGQASALRGPIGTLVDTATLFLERIGESPRPSASCPHVAAIVTADDRTILERAAKAKNGAKLSALLAGDISGYLSASEADLALASVLAFWTGPDPERLERLMRSSPLRRNKWDRHRTYLATTIATAIGGARSFYGWNRTVAG